MPTRDFSVIYDEYVWHVYGYFAYRLRDRTLAEDMTQKTFERALRAWTRYDPARASVVTWLLAIAHNLLVDHHRADTSSREQPLDVLDADDAALVSDHDRHDIGLAPDLELALAALSDREREIVALRFGGELTGPEIAALTGLTLANVQQILSRSLRRLRTILEQEDDAPPDE